MDSDDILSEHRALHAAIFLVLVLNRLPVPTEWEYQISPIKMVQLPELRVFVPLLITLIHGGFCMRKGSLV